VPTRQSGTWHQFDDAAAAVCARRSAILSPSRPPASCRRSCRPVSRVCGITCKHRHLFQQPHGTVSPATTQQCNGVRSTFAAAPTLRVPMLPSAVAEALSRSPQQRDGYTQADAGGGTRTRDLRTDPPTCSSAPAPPADAWAAGSRFAAIDRSLAHRHSLLQLQQRMKAQHSRADTAAVDSTSPAADQQEGSSSTRQAQAAGAACAPPPEARACAAGQRDTPPPCTTQQQAFQQIHAWRGLRARAATTIQAAVRGHQGRQEARATRRARAAAGQLCGLACRRLCVRGASGRTAGADCGGSGLQQAAGAVVRRDRCRWRGCAPLRRGKAGRRMQTPIAAGGGSESYWAHGRPCCKPWGYPIGMQQLHTCVRRVPPLPPPRAEHDCSHPHASFYGRHAVLSPPPPRLPQSTHPACRPLLQRPHVNAWDAGPRGPAAPRARPLGRRIIVAARLLITAGAVLPGRVHVPPATKQGGHGTGVGYSR
jgi:hypothetical protein